MSNIYLQFLKNAHCNRSREISILTNNFNVVHLFHVSFKHHTVENQSIYQMVFKDDEVLKDIDAYFYNHLGVKRLDEERVGELKEEDLRKQGVE